MKKVLIAGNDSQELEALIGDLIRNQDVEISLISQRQSSHISRPIKWSYCDVFSLEDLVRVMGQCEEVYVFGESAMLPLPLVQGSDENIEQLVLTNFIIAARINGVKVIHYLGKKTDEKLDVLTSSGIEFSFQEIDFVSESLVPNDVHEVRSIQKFVLPNKKTAMWVGEEYFRWLPKFLSNLVIVKYDGKECSFYLFNEMICILKLRRVASSYQERISFKVVGGLLNGKKSEGRLEFTESTDKKFVFGALHNFAPALPWIFYRLTQAIVHVFVMNAFGEHLKWCYLTEDKK